MERESEKKWRSYAQRAVKREMGRLLMSPSDLAKKMGISADSLRNKLRRAGFSAGFFLETLETLRVKQIDIEEIKRLEEEPHTDS